MVASMLMGLWTVLVAQPAFSALMPAQLAGPVRPVYEKSEIGTGSVYECREQTNELKVV